MVVLPFVPVTPIERHRLRRIAERARDQHAERDARRSARSTCGTVARLRPRARRRPRPRRARSPSSTNAWPSLRRPLHRDEHVAGLDLARVVVHRAHLDVAVADQARAGEAVDELPRASCRSERAASPISCSEASPGCSVTRPAPASVRRTSGRPASVRPRPSSFRLARVVERLASAHRRRTSAQPWLVAAARGRRLRRRRHRPSSARLPASSPAPAPAAPAHRPARRGSAASRSRSPRTPAPAT